MPVGPIRSRLRCWAIQAQVAREWTRALSRPRRGLCQSMSSSAAQPAEVGLVQAAPELALLALGPLGVHGQALAGALGPRLGPERGSDFRQHVVSRPSLHARGLVHRGGQLDDPLLEPSDLELQFDLPREAAHRREDDAHEDLQHEQQGQRQAHGSRAEEGLTATGSGFCTANAIATAPRIATSTYAKIMGTSCARRSRLSPALASLIRP